MESILVQAKKLIQILKAREDIIDLSEIKFAQPIITLPLAALVSEKGLKFTKPADDKCLGYLKYFNFPNGFSEFSKLSSKYIPIYKFTASKKDEKSLIDKSEIIENLIKICAQKIGSPKGVINALSIAIEEIIDNIEEHSGAKYGWINAQYYPTKEYLDVCILDLGITLLNNYKKHGMGISDDSEALKNALEGLSTKQLETVRGSGLRTFTNMIRDGFGGEMVIVSGQAIAYANNKEAPLVQKLSIDWPGTIVAIRIPQRSKSIDYTLYIE